MSPKYKNIKTCQTVLLSVVLYGSEHCHIKRSTKTMGTENTVPSGMFGARREEVAADWRRLRKGELHDLESFTNSIRMTTMVGRSCSLHV